MKYVQHLKATLGPSITKHVQRDSPLEDRLLSHAVDRLLYLPVPAIPALDRVGSRRQKLVIQERHCFVQRRREELLECLPHDP